MATYNILVVEKDLHSQKLITMTLKRDPMLKGLCHDVEVVSSGKEGLARFQKNKHDLVITDVMMPRLSGVELVEAIRAEEGGKSVPIIVMSVAPYNQVSLDEIKAKYDVELQEKSFTPQQLAKIEEGHSIAEILQQMDLYQAVQQMDVLLQCGMARRKRLKRPSSPLPAIARDPLNLERLASSTAQIAEKIRQAQLSIHGLEQANNPSPLHHQGERLAPAASPPRELEFIPRTGGENDTTETASVNLAMVAETLNAIDAIYLTIHQRSHYEVLDVPLDCSPEDLELAYNDKQRQFDLQCFQERDLGVHHARLEEINQHFAQAFKVLSDPVSRSEYTEALLQQASTSAWESQFQAEEAFDTGEFLAAEGRHKEAAKAYSQAVELDDQSEYRAMEAWANFKAHGEIPEVGWELLAAVRVAIDMAPTQPSLYVVAAWFCRSLGEVEAAIQYYQAALQLNPSFKRRLTSWRRSCWS